MAQSGDAARAAGDTRGGSARHGREARVRGKSAVQGLEQGQERLPENLCQPGTLVS